MNKKVIEVIKTEGEGWLEVVEVMKDPTSKGDRCIVCKVATSK